MPHIAPIGASFFVTFRLGDSLPVKVVRRLKMELNEKLEELEGLKVKNKDEEIAKLKANYFKSYEHQLDEKPYGECYLKKDEVARVVIEKLHEFDDDKYRLISYCIMPNHVHLLIDTSIQIVDKDGCYLSDIPENYFQLYQIMKRIKGGSAVKANRILNRTGKFWQKDSFDRFIRDRSEFYGTLYYILNNPVKAGLVNNWRDYAFSYVKEGVIEENF